MTRTYDTQKHMWQQSREPPASRALLSVLQLLVHPVVLEERQVLCMGQCGRVVCICVLTYGIMKCRSHWVCNKYHILLARHKQMLMFVCLQTQAVGSSVTFKAAFSPLVVPLTRSIALLMIAVCRFLFVPPFSFSACWWTAGAFPNNAILEIHECCAATCQIDSSNEWCAYDTDIYMC